MNNHSQKLSYAQRAEFTSNSTAKNLFNLMENKQTNLAVAADVNTQSELLEIAERLGPEICVLKTHIDILEDFEEKLINKLQNLAQKHRFLIFEDRKFADIGNTVQQQYQKGIYKISQWAHLTNAHPLPGPGIIQGLKQIGLPLGRGLLLLAEMSSSGALTTKTYAEAALKMAEEHRDFVIGFVSQNRLLDDPAYLYFTPGISLENSGDALGQQYRTPDNAIRHNGSDIIIVGRSILKAKNMQETARVYRQAGWEAYCKR